VIQLAGDDSESIDLLAVRRFRRALRLLLEAGDYSRRLACDPWEFAVDIRQFRRLRLSENDLRLLVRMKCLDHAREVTSSTDDRRVFRSKGNVVFTRRSCFVLTRLGISIAECVAAGSNNGPDHIRDCLATLSTGQEDSLLPFWDSHCRVLSFEGRTVKQLKCQAINQGQILSAFQEESWPRRILDPLVPQPCQDMKRRLNDTIKCLNRGHQHRLLHFRGDGTGEGVIWEMLGSRSSLR
jgi:hypothetical protein